MFSLLFNVTFYVINNFTTNPDDTKIRNGGKCDKTPFYVSIGGGWHFSLTCRRENNPETEGNYIRASITRAGAELFLGDVWAEYCKPKLPKCRCKSLLGTILEDYPKLDTIRGYFAAYPKVAGCRCYMGAAARAGFKYVTMKSGRDVCDDKQTVNANSYVELCNYYKKHKCGSSERVVVGKMTKEEQTKKDIEIIDSIPIDGI